MPRARDPAATPKECPGCGKTTIKVHRHDITPWVDEDGAGPIAWQCVSCGIILDRAGGSGRIVGGRRERIVLAPGEYATLGTYQAGRGRKEGGPR